MRISKNRQGRLRIFASGTLGVARNLQQLSEGMLSLLEIKEWVQATLDSESRLKLVEFCYKPAKLDGRAVIQIIFGDRDNEYRVWMFRKFNITYVDFIRGGVETETKLFRGPMTRNSLESISRILRRLQP